MIANIIDHRKRKYRWLNIDAVIEPTWHDNRCKDSDQALQRTRESVSEAYDDRTKISVENAVSWANSQPFPVTLYLYDLHVIRDENGKLVTHPMTEPA